ncbi:MAG TPA: lysylphosphatidylglycerol synthase transmembrane domain-containing protein [Acidimicrobiia bacterium]
MPVPISTPPTPIPEPAGPEAGATTKSARAHWKTGLRILVSAVVLTILVLKTPNLDGVVPHRNHLHSALLLGAALLLTLAGIVLSAWRWQRVLRVFEHRVGLGTLTAYTLAGQFVGNVLPSTIGGDVVRISRLGAVIDSNETAFASVAIERLTGFVALPALVVLGFALRPSLLDADHSLVALVIAALTIAALAAILTAAAHPKLAGRFADHQSWTRFIGAVHIGVDRLRRQPREALGVVGTALAYQASVVGAVLCIVRTLELPVPTAAVIAFVPAVAMAQVVPISIGGLGVREGMLVLFLHSSFGVRNAQAIAVGLLWYACVLVVSMLGAPAFAVGKRKQPRVAARVS